MAKLRILHLSDLHERGGREAEAWRRRRVLGDAWARNLDALCADGPPDLVCFTGDAADWGLAEEYQRVTDFFQALLDRLGVPTERFFTIPGNHDIQRKIEAAAWKKLRDKLSRVSAQEVSRWLSGGPAPLGLRDRQRDSVLRRQGAYRDWIARDMGLPTLLPDPALHPNLGYRRTLRLLGHSFDIHIIGLDSAWLCGDDNDSTRLRLTTDQVMRLATDPSGGKLPGFRLALVHHPLDDLADGADCRRLLAEQVDLLLRGHLHEAEPSLWADPERRLHQVAAGCLYEGHGADQYRNACAMIEIELDAAGRPEGYELWFRGWSGRGHWFDDNSLYADSQNGRLRVWNTPPPEPATPKPINPSISSEKNADLTFSLAMRMSIRKWLKDWLLSFRVGTALFG